MNDKDSKAMKTLIADPRLDLRRSPLAHRNGALTILAYEYGKGGLLPPVADCGAPRQASPYYD